MSKTVDKYGWNDNEVTNAHGYILPKIVELIKKIKPKKILDLGCGNGATANYLAKLGNDITGYDADEGGIEQAKKGGNAKFKCISIYEEPPENHEKFDLVISCEVVEHLFLPRKLPKYAYKVLDDNGTFIITTPYHGYIKNLVLSLLNKWDNHFTVFWDGGHIKFWSKKTLEKLLIEAGFKIISFHGVGRFPYLWKSMIIVAKK